MAKSICYDYRTDILLRQRDVSTLINSYLDEDYIMHHRAKRAGYVRDGYMILRSYSGRFGAGYILASNAGHGNVWVDYYIKGD